jgi:hypothetical protein
VETILKPSAPSTVASQTEMDLYQFRLAAAQFFSGRSISAQPAEGASPKASGAPVKKKKSVQGGC